MKKSFYKIISWLVAFSMVFGSFSITTRAEESSSVSETKIEIEEDNNNENQTFESELTNIISSDAEKETQDFEEDTLEIITDSNENESETFKEYEGENYKIVYSLNNFYSGYLVNIKITNTSLEPIHNWYMEMESGECFDHIWNAIVDNSNEDVYVLKNAGWNQDILPGETIEFGYNVNNDFVDFPKNISIKNVIIESLNDSYNIDYSINASWENEFIAEMTVKNVSDKSIEDWVLEFDYDNEINELWGAVITEKKDGHYTIGNAGYNSIINANESVTFGFKGTGDNEITPENYKLYEYGYEEETVITDKSALDEVMSNLNIGFVEGNDYNSVTSDIYLAEKIGDVEVAWISDNPSVISESGIVNRSSETQYVKLTAILTYEGISDTKDFSVRVIKDTYKDYNTDYIYDMDSLELLYIYNEPENLEVYINDDGYVTDIVGKFSEIVVESPDEAILSLYEVKSLMGCESPKDQLVWVSTSKDNYGYSYKFRQIVDGVTVYGKSIVVSTDTEGNTTSLRSSFNNNISIDKSTIISSDDATKVVKAAGYEEPNNKGLYIYITDSEHLVYEIEAIKDSLVYSILIDANSKEILLNNLITIGEDILSRTGTDLLGNSRTFSINRYANNTIYGSYLYTLDDNKRNIRFYNLNGLKLSSKPGTKIIKNTDTWTAEEISAVANAAHIYDYYYNHFGRLGTKGNNSPLYVCINMGEQNSYADTYTIDGTSQDILVFGEAGSSYSLPAAAGLDTMAHEFTHRVVAAETDLAKNYSNEPGAINEGYADIFGYFVEGDNDPAWEHGEDNHKRAIRILSKPGSKSMPSAIGDKYYHDYTVNSDDHGGVHTNNSLVSYPCYLMWYNGISDKDRLAQLWYGSLRLGYDMNATFSDVRKNVLISAKNMSMSADEIKIIKDAFDTVGITATDPVEISGTNVLIGKVVIADIDTISGNNDPLQGATIKLVRNTSEVKTELSVSDGSFSFINLLPGTYTLTVSKVGYLETTQTITLTSAKLTNYCSTIELIPLKYTGLGTAKGTIKDSVTGLGVSDLTLKIRTGMNSKTSKVVGTYKTDADGSYEINLDAGHYCIEVIDQRTLTTGQKKYYVTYFNIKVLGGVTISNQNATVSTSLSTSQLRIVLEWGAKPYDLDSHLEGPTSSGSRFHVYYGNKYYKENGQTIADLDLDDTTSYGPETTTIYNPVTGEYLFYVYNFSGSPDIKTSGASVKVFTGNSNEPAFEFYVPLTGSGYYWTVFSYDAKTRRVTPINIVSNSVSR